MATAAEAPAGPMNSERINLEADVLQKRKASKTPEELEGSSKRARIEDDDRPDPTTQSSPLENRRRESDAGTHVATGRRSALSRDEEKKRGKRLFGGLLSTLSQSNTSSQHKKRREIEQRQQERAQKQRAEDDKKRAENLVKVTELRWNEQINFDEKVMKTRHSNMLAMAHSLKTKARPSICYRPWSLTREQDEMIDNQIKNAKATIARETDSFNERREEHERRYGRSGLASKQEETAPAAGERLADDAPAPDTPAVDAPAADTATASSQDRDKHERDPHDEAGDVVEDAEDTVIY